MELYSQADLRGEELDLLYTQVSAPTAYELQERSHEFFVVTHEGKALVVGGMISGMLVSDIVYLWAVFAHREFDFRMRRSGWAVAMRFLRSFPERVFAEVALQDWKSKRFLEALGFVQLHELEDRQLFEWVK